MGAIGFPNNKDYYASAGYASGGNFLGLTGGNTQKVNPSEKGIEELKGSGSVGATGSAQHLGAEVGLVDRLGQYDAGSLNNPTHKSVVEGYSNGLAERLDLRG